MTKRINLDAENIADLYNAGFTCKEIAKHLGVSQQTIIRRLDKKGIARRKLYIDYDINKIIRLYNIGYTAQEVANRVGASKATVLRRLRSHGINIRPLKFSLNEKDICSEYAKGISSNNIAAKLGVSACTVLQRLRANNMVVRSPAEAASLKDGHIMGLDTYRDHEWLYYQYYILKKSQETIALECGTDQQVIGKWMHKHGFRARSQTESATLHVNHFTLSNESIAFIDGLLLGDGYLQRNSFISARYGHVDKHRLYALWLKERLGEFRIELTGKIRQRNGITHGHKFTSYSLDTRAYSEFLPFWEKWYSLGKKIVPADIVLSPLTCQGWYIGDGCLANPARGRKYIVLYTNGFPEKDVHMLIDKLTSLDIMATYQRGHNAIRLNPDNALKFLDYIGPCPKGIFSSYGYKWDLGRTKKEWEAKFSHA